MTERELNEVRDLRDKIREKEWHAETLRRTADDLVPVRDGLPKDKTPHSRVESLIVKVRTLEQEADNLRGEMAEAAIRLTDKLSATLKGQELQVMTLRYVNCQRFLDIQEALDLSDARVFYLHRQALKKLKSNNSKVTVEVQ